VFDTIHLGANLTVVDQAFAQVTSYNTVDMCQGVEGMLGLGRGDRTMTGAQTALLSNLFADAAPIPIFSLYLDKTDDYQRARTRVRHRGSDQTATSWCAFRDRLWGCQSPALHRLHPVARRGRYEPI
jgi:Eukaryotic aspartyl protease